MRYRLRTLLILLAVGPLIIWAGWLGYEAFATALIRGVFGPIEVLPVETLEKQGE